MNSAEVFGNQFAYRYFKVFKKRIKDWIVEHLENNHNTPTEFSNWYKSFIADDDVSDLTIEKLVECQLLFLDLGSRESITTKISHWLQIHFDSLQDEILAEMEDVHTNEEQQDYYRSVL